MPAQRPTKADARSRWWGRWAPAAAFVAELVGFLVLAHVLLSR